MQLLSNDTRALIVSAFPRTKRQLEQFNKKVFDLVSILGNLSLNIQSHEGGVIAFHRSFHLSFLSLIHSFRHSFSYQAVQLFMAQCFNVSIHPSFTHLLSCPSFHLLPVRTWSIHPSIHPSILPATNFDPPDPINPSIHPYIYLTTHPSILHSPSIHPPIQPHPSIYPSIHPPNPCHPTSTQQLFHRSTKFHPSIHLASIYPINPCLLSFHLSIIYPSIHEPSIHPATYSSIHTSTHQFKPSIHLCIIHSPSFIHPSIHSPIHSSTSPLIYHDT